MIFYLLCLSLDTNAICKTAFYRISSPLQHCNLTSLIIFKTIENASISYLSTFICQTLLKAARGGKWSPDMSLITFHLTPWLFEMALAIPLPWPCYLIFWSFLNLVSGCVLPWGNLCSIGVRSPAQCDLLEGRRTMTDLHLAEIVLVSESVGKKHARHSTIPISGGTC